MGWRGPLVYVDDVTSPVISSEDRHHLQRVLRVRDGSRMAVCDGRGSWRIVRLGSPCIVDSDIRVEPKPEPELTLSVAVPKGDRADWMMQKVTEIGIDRVVIIEAEHSVVRWSQERAAKQLARLARIVRSASSQSRRAWLPEVLGPVRFADAAAAPGAVLAHPGGGPIALGHRNVLIGPEGGWSANEIGGGFPTVGLAPQVLRVETAALVASTLLVALRSRLVLPSTFGSENALGG